MPKKGKKGTSTSQVIRDLMRRNGYLQDALEDKDSIIEDLQEQGKEAQARNEILQEKLDETNSKLSGFTEEGDKLRNLVHGEIKKLKEAVKEAETRRKRAIAILIGDMGETLPIGEKTRTDEPPPKRARPNRTLTINVIPAGEEYTVDDESFTSCGYLVTVPIDGHVSPIELGRIYVDSDVHDVTTLVINTHIGDEVTCKSSDGCGTFTGIVCGEPECTIYSTDGSTHDVNDCELL